MRLWGEEGGRYVYVEQGRGLFSLVGAALLCATDRVWVSGVYG